MLSGNPLYSLRCFKISSCICKKKTHFKYNIARHHSPNLLSIVAKFFHHFVETVTGIVVHVVPKVDRNAFVALSYMMIPKAGKVQQVPSVQTNFVGCCIRVAGKPFQIWLQRIHADPLDHPWFTYFYSTKVLVCPAIPFPSQTRYDSPSRIGSITIESSFSCM